MAVIDHQIILKRLEMSPSEALATLAEKYGGWVDRVFLFQAFGAQRLVMMRTALLYKDERRGLYLSDHGLYLTHWASGLARYVENAAGIHFAIPRDALDSLSEDFARALG
ncbi:MAG: hypothetical protein NXH85_13555 [Pseudomonadaceae bacterium]|nr:hypothetical protein [Pseudomonadaceae bacterium]